MNQSSIKHWDKQVTFGKTQYHQFGHQAMHTTFAIWINHNDSLYAAQAAHEAFLLLDRLEELLSKFIPNSDIGRFNAWQSQDPIVVDPVTYQCIDKARSLYQTTNGLFDISLGTGLETLKLDLKAFTIAKANLDLKLDLGGIGKGMAVDQMVQSLQEWDIESALVHGGASSVYAYGQSIPEKGWHITVSNPWPPEETLYYLDLNNIALGCSGLLKGNHIINPHKKKPTQKQRAVWVAGPDAVTMDALSTAFMMMSLEDISSYIQSNTGISSLVLIKDTKSNTFQRHLFGSWPN